jgi:hypothetical protein
VCDECTEARSCRPETKAVTKAGTKAAAEAGTKAGTKRCSMCGVRQPLDMFSRAAGRKDGRYPSCRPCRAVARRGDTPALAEALLDKTASFAPDPGPAVALRRELVAARRAGVSFEEAWLSGLAAAREAARPREIESWENVLWQTRGAWASAFHREVALAGHGALSTLAEAA